MTILLVEPDRILGHTVQLALQAVDCEVVWKRSAQTALDALDEQIPDVIILEPQLGLHNGVEFLYEIASYPEWQHIPVIIHTINVRARGEIFASSLRQLHVQVVLYKPQTTTTKLIQAVKQFAQIV